MPTTSYGYELTPGDDAGLDDIPVCCGDDMTGTDTGIGGRDYNCRTCGAVVAIAPNGLVFDITA